MRLIDAESLSSMRFTHEMHDSEGRLYVPFDEVAEAIFKAPTVHPDRRETTCKHRTPDGLCRLHTDDEVTWYCVDGPCLNEEPIPEIEPVKHGRWIVVSDGYGNGDATAHICECSECKDTIWVYKKATRRWNYCPNCGAKMDLKEEAETEHEP